MAKRIDPGQLRHRLTLQQANHFSDEHGGFVTTWTDLVDMWAQLTPLREDLQPRAGANEVDLTHQIIVRHIESIETSMRFVLGTRIFEVRTVRDLDETRRYTSVLAREVTN